MIIQFEASPPFRLRPKVERMGPMTRIIWTWFSVAYYHRVNINGLFRAFMEEGRSQLLREQKAAEEPLDHVPKEQSYTETKTNYEGAE